VTCPVGSGDGSVQAAAAVAQQQLSSIAGVQDVVLDQVAGVVPPLELVTPASAVETSNGSCPYTFNPANPDWLLGRDREGVPYGIKLVQADDNEFIQLSKGVKDKVLYCVIDSGMDMNNIEIPRGRLQDEEQQQLGQWHGCMQMLTTRPIAFPGWHKSVQIVYL